MMFLNAVAAGRRRYPVITDKLSLYLDAYNLDSYSGSGSTWNDLSNSGYNITITGPTWTESGGRRYFEFDGVNDYMIGPSDVTHFDLTTSGNTWSFWIYYVTSPASLDAIMITNFVSGGGARTRYIALDNRNVFSSTTGEGYNYVYYNDGPPVNQKFVLKGETVTTGSWFQLTYVFLYTTTTTGTMKIYKNGTEIATANQTLAVGSTWTSMNSWLKPVIGAINLNGTLSRFNNIRLGEVLHYKKSLTATEVSDNYNSTKSNYGL